MDLSAARLITNKMHVLDQNGWHRRFCGQVLTTEPREEHWDVVEGIKKTRGMEPVTNRIGARFFYRTLSRLSGYNLYGSSDFKLLDRKV